MDKPGSTSTPLVQVLIALIGVIGSMGVAWITTGAKFDEQLKTNADQVSSLKEGVTQFGTEFKGLVRERTEATRQLDDSLRALRMLSAQQLALLATEQEEAKAQVVSLRSSLDSIRQQNRELIALLQSTNEKAVTVKRDIDRLSIRAGNSLIRP